MFVEAFIEPARQQRYLDQSSSDKRRCKILDRFNHRLDLRSGVDATELPFNMATGDLVAELQIRGAPEECYIIADSCDDDGKVMPIGVAATLVLSHPFGIVLSCAFQDY